VPGPGALVDGALVDGALVDGALVDGALVDGAPAGAGESSPTSYLLDAAVTG
jgi:RNA polymerase sigma-B factor